MSNSSMLQKQKLLIEYLLSSADTYSLCRTILEPKYFLPELRNSVEFINQYYDQFRSIPSPEQVLVETDIKYNVHKLTRDQIEYCAREVETFCKRKAMEDFIRTSPQLLDQEDYGAIQQKMKDALAVSLNKDLGISYFSDPFTRLEEQMRAPARIPTHMRELDQLLGGGLARKEIILFMANSGGGKSITLANLALNMVQQKLNVLYISLELSEELIAQRYDTMLTGIPSVAWQRQYQEIAKAVKKEEEKYGELIIKRVPTGTNTNAIRSYLKELELKKGYVPDLLVVDYLDLMSANEKVSADNVWEKDKRASEQLRDLGGEYNMIVASASQQNRSAVGADEINQSHIAGGISKINTVDWAISIIFNPSMKAEGTIGFFFVKARSSDAVGKAFYMDWDNKYLRIRNPKTSEEEDFEILKRKVVNVKPNPKSEKKLPQSLEDLFDKDL